MSSDTLGQQSELFSGQTEDFKWIRAGSQRRYVAAAAAPVLTAAPRPTAEFDFFLYFLPLLSL